MSAILCLTENYSNYNDTYNGLLMRCKLNSTKQNISILADYTYWILRIIWKYKRFLTLFRCWSHLSEANAKNRFRRAQKSWIGGGYPHLVIDGGGTPIQSLTGGTLGIPHPDLGWGYPLSAGWGTPHPDLQWGYTLSAGWGYPHLDLGWSTPQSAGWGTPIWTCDGGTPHPGPDMGSHPPPMGRTGYHPPPVEMWTDKLKILPSPIFRMRAVMKWVLTLQCIFGGGILSVIPFHNTQEIFSTILRDIRQIGVHFHALYVWKRFGILEYSHKLQVVLTRMVRNGLSQFQIPLRVEILSRAMSDGQSEKQKQKQLCHFQNCCWFGRISLLCPMVLFTYSLCSIALIATVVNTPVQWAKVHFFL